MRYFVIHSFTDQPFSGNPAGVCIVDRFPEDFLMQRIAAENRLPETAFVAPWGDDFALRWFTPKVEVPLCGHATLAAAHVLLRTTGEARESVAFHTKSGVLTVRAKEDWLEMDFPAQRLAQTKITDAMQRAVDAPILEANAGRNLMMLLESEGAVRDAVPDIDRILSMTEYHGVIITAQGSDCDFVSRFFAPSVGIAEDPVTGSTHTSLAPYWAARLGRETLVARQLSARGGTLRCRCAGERVFIEGQACLYLVGEIQNISAAVMPPEE